MKKKLLTLVLAATMALSFAACGSNGDDSASNRSSSAAQSSTASSAPSTASSAPAESSTQAEADTMTLEEWLKTDDAKQAESATNAQLASSGMSVKLDADGDIFVYEYTLTKGDFSGLTTEDLAAAFDPVIEANAQGLADLFSSFEDTYGIKLGGVRFTFLAADGTELYSGDVANE